MNNEKSFFSSLFDFSFSSYITTRFIRIIYAVAVIFSAFGGLMAFGTIVGMGFDAGNVLGILSLGFGALVGVLVFLLYLIIARVWLEILVVVFRIAENVQRMADRPEGP